MFIFLVVSTIVIIILFLITIYDPIKTFVEKHFFTKVCWKKLYQIACKNDYLLLNNVNLELGREKIKFSHLLCADKFIYVIRDTYLTGGIRGNYLDENLFLIKSKQKKIIINNPIILNADAIKSLASVSTDGDKKFWVNIVLTNNSLLIDKDLLDGIVLLKNTYFIHLKDLEKTIKRVESQEVNKLEVTSMENTILEIQKQTKNNNKKTKNN